MASKNNKCNNLQSITTKNDILLFQQFPPPQQGLIAVFTPLASNPEPSRLKNKDCLYTVMCSDVTSAMILTAEVTDKNS